MASNATQVLFTDKAKAYAKYRPDYPKEVIDKILHPFENPSELQALDVGAGTGIASRLLGDRGVQVLAAEPNKAMIESAESHPNVEYMHASAENIGVESNSMDLVTVFQAFHWFDFKKSLKEFNRLLKPSGQIAIIWSYWNYEDDFTAKYAELIRQSASKNPDRVSPYDAFPSGLIKKVRMKLLWKFRHLPYFQNTQRNQYKYTRDADLNILNGDARSQSYLIHEGKPWHDLLKEIEELYNNSEKPQLVYKINVFTAQPKK